MTRAAAGRRVLAVAGVLALALGACTRTSVSTSVTPAAVYTGALTLADTRALLGDNAWWPGPPSFRVRPLDSATMPFQERYAVIQRFVHVGTAETFDVEYSLWDTTSSASTQMTNIRNAFGTSATGPKAGDQVLYYGSQTSSAAPYSTATFVRVGQFISSISWSLKDGFPKVAKLARIASKVATRLRDVVGGKAHTTSLAPTDPTLLPPAGPDITLLGSTPLPIEAAVVMLGAPSPAKLAQTFHSNGVDTIVFADYALDNDTHMEVRAGLFTFLTTQDAGMWLDAFRGTTALGAGGIAGFYDDPSGQYFYLFKAGTRVGMLVCRSTSSVEAASRACESPMSRVAPAWELSLGG